MAKQIFVVSQAEFDLAFSAGAADARLNLSHHDALMPILAPMSGLVDNAASERWSQLRDAFVQGYAAEGVDPDTAARRWTRLVESLGLTKPQSVAAAAKAAQRARAQAKGAVNGKVETSTGKDAVAAVASADKVVSESARLSACIELLKHFDNASLIKAQGLLLSLAEQELATI